MSNLDHQLASHVRHYSLPGALVGVMHGPDRDYAAAGTAAADTGTPLTIDSAARIASLTKPVTAAATVLASRESPEGLGRPMCDLLPPLRSDWHADPNLTLEQALGQVSGLRDGVDAQTLAGLGDADDALIRACALVARLGQTRPPGAGWEYYNGNYFLAGAALASMRGTTFELAVSQCVLVPAQMNRTGFAKPELRARGHHDGRVIDEDYPRARRPSGGLWSTVGDLTNFADFVMSDKELLSTVQRAHTEPDWPIQYGLGWALDGDLMFHNGRLNGFRSLLLLAPADHFSVAMIVNDTEGLPAVAEFVGTLVTEHLGRPAPADLMF